MNNIPWSKIDLNAVNPNYETVDGATFVRCNEERLKLIALNAELARALQSIVFYWDSPEMAKLPASTMAQARAALAKANHG